jgi:hypothetical protein
MTICVAAGGHTLHATDHTVRVLRWTFRRDEDAVICELGLARDTSVYELMVNRPRSPAGTTTEMFDDAMSAFERQAAIERTLVGDGWMLEHFESEQILRTA